MRCLVFPGLFLCCALAAQNTPPGKTPPPASGSNFLAPLVLPKLTAPSPAQPKPMDAIDARFFLPQNYLPDPAKVSLPEPRTAAQLESMLAAYVGTWRGEGSAFYLSAGKVMHYPVELVYQYEQYEGRRVLGCTGTYTLPGGLQVLHERLWVEKGRIVAVLNEGQLQQTFAAHTNGQNLSWYATDSLNALMSFSQTETLRLTADGGELTSRGFQIERNAFGPPTIVYQTTDLKLGKN